MLLEILLAVIVGLGVLALIFQPLLRARPALAWNAPSALDDLDDDSPKNRALAALREIEFDRETGKLTDADFQELYARYQSRAVEALRAEEAGQDAPAGSDVEAIVAAKVQALRTGAGGKAGRICHACGPRPEANAVFCSSCGGRLPTGAACLGCGSPLQPGVKFCEVCGHAVAA